MNTQTTLVPSDLRPALLGDPFWERYLQSHILQPTSTCALHLAILVKPYLQMLLDGLKTIESRFSINRRAPYGCVHAGDVVLLKRSGGPIVGIGHVTTTWYYRLKPGSLQHIQDEFANELCVDDPSFWSERARASFATLLRLQHVRRIEPIEYVKKDQRGWVVLQPRRDQPPLLVI